ncbi:MAG: hypothetical protein KJ795_02195, partial [Gammaproteobacteria bacterium]|nr:hypothetical protein [Gammaproteobacteria bacterium]MBU1776146.1 hypothetical protein [Gammaproteobacteria bacterium]
MKTPLTLAILIAVLLTGCAGTNAKPHAYAPSQTKVELLGNGLRFERVPVADHPCEPANIYFINEAKGVRQVVID